MQGRKICVLGLTYKADTSTLRRSAALEVISELAQEGAEVSASDPKADRTELATHRGFTFHEDPIAAVQGADAVVLMTSWVDYKALDFAAVKAVMRGDLVYDTANLWQAEAVSAAGLRYLDIGRGRAARS
ncbi:MAG: UDP binding domain-containing protein [Verrucomicrobia bacterium]|nr:UDP binding domain-containing protein [Verrucomicrobiota bacterium]